MKKFIANAQVRNLVLPLFFLLGLMVFGSGSASAQTTVGGSANWISDGAAVTVLTSKVQALKQNELLSSTCATYAPAEATYHFYVGMVESINAGMTTEAAFNANVVHISSQPSVNDLGSSAINQNCAVDVKAITTSAKAFLTY